MDSTSLSIAQLKKPLLQATIGLFSVSALLGVLFVLIAPEGETWKILATTTLLAFFSLFTTNNLLRLESPKKYIKVFASAAIVSNLLWAIPLLLTIWVFLGSSWSNYEIIWRMIWTFSLLSICLTMTGSFLNMKSASIAFQNTRIAAIASAWLLYVYILPVVYGVDAEYIGESWQFIAIASIIFAFSAISTPILARLKAAPKQQANSDADYRARIRAELRAEVEAEVRQQIANEQAAQHKDTNESS